MAHPAYDHPEYKKARRRLIGRPCWMCGTPADQIDHLIPKRTGISPDLLNQPDNLAPICRSCNNKRNRKPKRRQGRL